MSRVGSGADRPITHFWASSDGALNRRRSWNRIDGVDLLRSLAIFFVLMNHVNMRLRSVHLPYTEGLPDQLVSSLVWNGQFGVQMFFAVSGFLITSTAVRRWGSLSRINIFDFYRLRFARIAPLLLLLLAALSFLHLLHFPDFVVPAKTGGLGRALFAALTFHVNLLEARRGYLPANWDILWSLSVEEVFYLFFPLLCRLLGQGKRLVAVLLVLATVAPFGRTVLAHGNPVWKEYSYLGGMDAIALGCLTALLMSKVRFSRPILWVFAICGGAMLILILGFSMAAYRSILGPTSLNMTVLALGACMLIVVSAQTLWRSPRVFGPVLRLGQRSYEIYLTHMFVVFAFFDLFKGLGKPIRAVPALFLVVILVAGLLGELVSVYYSEPVNQMLREKWGDAPDRLGSVVED